MNQPIWGLAFYGSLYRLFCAPCYTEFRTLARRKEYNQAVRRVYILGRTQIACSLLGELLPVGTVPNTSLCNESCDSVEGYTRNLSREVALGDSSGLLCSIVKTPLFYRTSSALST